MQHLGGVLRLLSGGSGGPACGLGSVGNRPSMGPDMNLRQGQGKVPIFAGGETPWLLVDWPTREAFDEMFKRSSKRDSIWWLLRARSEGTTLQELSQRFGISRERIRQYEARFQRKMRESLTV